MKRLTKICSSVEFPPLFQASLHVHSTESLSSSIKPSIVKAVLSG